MKIRELIDCATAATNQTQGEIAQELGVKPARLSEWKSGQRKPDADEIAFFAEKAGLSVLTTVAEIQASFNPRYAEIWKRAVSQASKIRVNP